VKIGIYWADWQEEIEDGSSELIDNKSHTLCPGNKLGDSSSIAFRSMLRRPFQYPPAAMSSFTSLLKHLKNGEVILQTLGKLGIEWMAVISITLEFLFNP
jgi:hypothetical protein